jgi:hypothetical protein
MPSPVPATVFVIHHGSQDYLKIAAQFVKKFGNQAILIGNDAATGQICDQFFEDSKIPLPLYEAFERHYVHMSTATREFELLCFKRYFYLYEVAKQLGLNHFWMIDSDLVLTTDLSKLQQHPFIHQCEAAFSTPHQEEHVLASSPHCSYWTLSGLEKFIQFLGQLYQGDSRRLLDEKYAYHQAHKIPGGICDMTALYLWQKTNLNILNLANAHLHDLPLFDNNLNQTGNCFDHEFEMVGNVHLKKITSQNGHYQAYLSGSNTAVPVAALHFQGTAKACMATFLKTNEITYWAYAPYAFQQYVEKRKNSLKRKLRKIIG